MNRQIIEEAAQWFVEFGTGDADARAKKDFDAWLRKSPENVRAYLELMPIWNDGALPLPGADNTAEDLIALARDDDGVVTLEPVCPVVRSRPARTRRRVVLAAAVASVLFAGGVVAWLQMPRAPTYTTDLGEQRTIRLADGSTMELNTHSRVRVNFTGQLREIELLEGQALFRVARDKLRPFIVSSDSARVRAVGTEFDVYRKPEGLTVTVLEGRVAIHEGAGSAGGEEAADQKPVLLSAGEQMTLAAALPRTPARANLTAAAAWTQGRLIFDSTPLAEVAREFNRYNARHIVVEDESLRDFLVSGSFGSSDPSSLLRFLRAQPGLAVHETASRIRIARR